jgi:hypothetical protein
MKQIFQENIQLNQIFQICQKKYSEKINIALQLLFRRAFHAGKLDLTQVEGGQEHPISKKIKYRIAETIKNALSI